MCFRYAKNFNYLGRTVLVKNDAEKALSVLNTVLAKENLFDIYKRTRYHEKPCRTRRRVILEHCKGIYNEDMDNKINFFLRKTRLNPMIGY